MSHEIPDKSLLRCTVKKSWATTTKLAKAVAILGFAIGILFGLYTAIANNWSTIVATRDAFIATLSQTTSFVISGLVSIPWYIYVILAIPICIFGHSLLWCIARELTKADWESNAAEVSAIISGYGGFVVWIISIFVATFVIDPVFIVVIIIFAPVGILLCAIIILESTTPASFAYRVLRFAGAWYYHRKTTKLLSENDKP